MKHFDDNHMAIRQQFDGSSVTIRRQFGDNSMTIRWQFVQRMVHGPSAKYDLEEGESELVDVAVWRYSY